MKTYQWLEKLTSRPCYPLVLSQRQQELRLSQRLIGRPRGEDAGLDDLIGGERRGWGGCGCSRGGADGDLAELSCEVRRAETAISLQTDASVLTEQRAEDCRRNHTKSSDIYTQNKQLKNFTLEPKVCIKHRERTQLVGKFSTEFCHDETKSKATSSN